MPVTVEASGAVAALRGAGRRRLAAGRLLCEQLPHRRDRNLVLLRLLEKPIERVEEDVLLEARLAAIPLHALTLSATLSCN